MKKLQSKATLVNIYLKSVFLLERIIIRVFSIFFFQYFFQSIYRYIAQFSYRQSLEVKIILKVKSHGLI